MNTIVTKGIVLRRIHYQEADRIVTFITPDNGKVTVIAKGVRRAKSKLAGSIEPFGTSNISILPGKGDMGTLISARLIENFGNIVTDLKRIEFASKILQLINKSIDGISEEGFYDLLEQTLKYLNQTEIDVELVKLWFELNFLSLMGHAPNMEVIVNKESDNYNFDLDKMQFIAEEHGIYSKNHVKVFRIALVTNPNQLNRVTDINKLMEKILNLAQLMMIKTGFNPV